MHKLEFVKSHFTKLFPVNTVCSVQRGEGSLSGKLLGKEHSPLMALDVDLMDINTVHDVTVGLVMGSVAGFTVFTVVFTHNTLERGLKSARLNHKCRQAMSALIFGSNSIE